MNREKFKHDGIIVLDKEHHRVLEEKMLHPENFAVIDEDGNIVEDTGEDE